LPRFGYGIIGCGWVASAHAWGVQSLVGEDVQLVAVTDAVRARAEALAGKFDVVRIHDDYHDLLADDDISAVSICLPDHLHKDVAIAAAEAGKHVLCEKPLALNVDQADEMLRASHRWGTALGLIMNHRYAPDNIRVKRAIDAGALGRVLVGSVMHSSCLVGDPSGSSPWRGRRGLAAGGILTTQAIHFLDLLLWFAGPVEAVKAWTARLARPEQDYEDTAAIAMQMASGALSTLITTNGAPIEDDFTGTRIEVQGTDGYIMLEGDVVRLCVTPAGSELPGLELPDPPRGSAEVVFGSGHIYEVMDFVRAVRHGHPPPIPGEDGRHLLAVLEAAYQSAEVVNQMSVREGPDAYSSKQAPTSLLSGLAGT